MAYRKKARRATGGHDDRGAAAGRACSRLLTIEQVTNGSEERLQAVLDGVETGELEVYRLEGGRVRFDEVEVENFLSSGKAADGATNIPA